MALLDFKAQMAKDVDDTFLTDFAVDAIYTSNGIPENITVQLFKEPLDKLGTEYYLAWTKYSLIPNVAKNDTLEIDGVVYGVVDFEPDEFEVGVDLFLQEV